MPPKVEIWTKEKENLLIYLVESCPTLWDVSCKDYKRTDKKYSQWHEIANNLGPSFDADTVQQIFASMWHTFMVNYRKERESRGRCSGKGTDEIYKPKWVLYDKLKLKKKMCTQATSVSNLQSPSRASFFGEIEYSQDIEEDTYQHVEYLEDDTDMAEQNFSNTQQWQPVSADNKTQLHRSPDHNSECKTGYIRPNSSSSLNTSLRINQPACNSSTAQVTSGSTSKLCDTNDKENMYVKRGAAKKRKESLIEEAVTAIKTLSNQPTPVLQNDIVEHFGNFVMAKLREMLPDDRKRCEEEIMKILYKY